MKRLKLFSLLTVLIISLGIGGVVQASEFDAAEKHEDDFLKKEMASIQEEYPEATFEKISFEEYNALKESMKENQLDYTYPSYYPAPPVTSVYIRAIESENGYENVINKYETVPVKGKVSISTMEIGYGASKHWLGNVFMGNNPNFHIQIYAIDLNGNGYADAFHHIVTFDSDKHIGPKSSKVYQFETVSYNYPWNLMSTWINIVHE